MKKTNHQIICRITNIVSFFWCVCVSMRAFGFCMCFECHHASLFRNIAAASNYFCITSTMITWLWLRFGCLRDSVLYEFFHFVFIGSILAAARCCNWWAGNPVKLWKTSFLICPLVVIWSWINFIITVFEVAMWQGVILGKAICYRLRICRVVHGV